jgi:hypothetical protein
MILLSLRIRQGGKKCIWQLEFGSFNDFDFSSSAQLECATKVKTIQEKCNSYSQVRSITETFAKPSSYQGLWAHS